MKIFINTVAFLLIANCFNGQVVENLNFAVSSHPMKINRIEFLAKQVKITISIENQLEGGNFCADKNIDVIDILNNRKHHLIKAEGIPVCPSNYQFNSVGEVLTFNLIFPAINSSTKYINIIENCNQYCFSIKGIILNKALNNEINLAYDYYSKGKLDFALQAFKLIIDNNPDYQFGLFYFNMIQILAEKQDYNEAKSWYSKLKNSNFIDKSEVISRLKNQYYYLNIIWKIS